ncbi:MAG: FkbM family methyltransferase [Acetobacteraceae bacterium]|nr:FkbM family methyltransferase [Acetobacteraceae bacterium]
MDELTFHARLHRPGTILDVGAHDGLLAVPLARLPGTRLLAFEPLPPAFDRLRAALAGLPAEPRREAVGDTPGEVALRVPLVDGEPAEQWASLAKDYAAHAGLGWREWRVPVITLDSLALPDVTAIKLDVEGHEYEALRGARETLLRCRPVLSIELEERHREGSTWAVPAYLDALGYGCWFHHGGWRPWATLDRATMQRASPDPRVFAASDPYIFTCYAWPREDTPDMLARLS